MDLFVEISFDVMKWWGSDLPVHYADRLESAIWGGSTR